MFLAELDWIQTGFIFTVFIHSDCVQSCFWIKHFWPFLWVHWRFWNTWRSLRLKTRAWSKILNQEIKPCFIIPLLFLLLFLLCFFLLVVCLQTEGRAAVTELRYNCSPLSSVQSNYSVDCVLIKCLSSAASSSSSSSSLWHRSVQLRFFLGHGLIAADDLCVKVAPGLRSRLRSPVQVTSCQAAGGHSRRVYS